MRTFSHEDIKYAISVAGLAKDVFPKADQYTENDLGDYIVSWGMFHAALIDRIGEARAQRNFIEQTGYTESRVQHWRTTKQVPLEAVASINQIDLSKCPKTLYQGYHDKEFVKRVIELSSSTETIKGIAARVSKEFGQPVTESMVKGIRFRNKDLIANYHSRRDSIDGIGDKHGKSGKRNVRPKGSDTGGAVSSVSA